MADIFTPPGNIEAAALAYLGPFLPAALVTTQRPFGTDWQEPVENLIVRLQVVDGDAPQARVLDPWTLTVEVWHRKSVTASNICAEAVGRLNAWSGRYAGVLIYQCLATRPRSVPDPLTRIPRYLSTATGTARLLNT